MGSRHRGPDDRGIILGQPKEPIAHRVALLDSEHRATPVLLGLFVFCGAVGFLDDLLKVRKPNSDGLSAKGKLLGQVIVCAGFGVAALYVTSTNGQTVASERISLIREISWLNVGKVGTMIVFVLVVTAMSNGVNLTDGLDGLATGASALVLGAGFWQYRHWCADDAYARVNDCCYTEVKDPVVNLVCTIAPRWAAAAGWEPHPTLTMSGR